MRTSSGSIHSYFQGMDILNLMVYYVSMYIFSFFFSTFREVISRVRFVLHLFWLRFGRCATDLYCDVILSPACRV